MRQYSTSSNSLPRWHGGKYTQQVETRERYKIAEVGASITTHSPYTICLASYGTVDIDMDGTLDIDMLSMCYPCAIHVCGLLLALNIDTPYRHCI